MIEKVVFVEDKDFEFIRAVSEWATEHNLECFCFSNGIQLIRSISQFTDKKTLFIIDYFLPNIQGNDLIDFLIKNGIDSKNIILTSIVKEYLNYFSEYYKLLGTIYKTTIKEFTSKLSDLLETMSFRYRTTRIFLSTDCIVNLEFGYIFSKETMQFIKLTKLEQSIFKSLVLIPSDFIIGKIKLFDVSTSSIWRLNKKLVQFGFKIVKRDMSYILVKL